MEIEFIPAFAYPTALPLKTTWNASLVFHPHHRLHRSVFAISRYRDFLSNLSNDHTHSGNH